MPRIAKKDEVTEVPETDQVPKKRPGRKPKVAESVPAELLVTDNLEKDVEESLDDDAFQDVLESPEPAPIPVRKITKKAQAHDTNQVSRVKIVNVPKETYGKTYRRETDNHNNKGFNSVLQFKYEDAIEEFGQQTLSECDSESILKYLIAITHQAGQRAVCGVLKNTLTGLKGETNLPVSIARNTDALRGRGKQYNNNRSNDYYDTRVQRSRDSHQYNDEYSNRDNRDLQTHTPRPYSDQRNNGERFRNQRKNLDENLDI